MKFLTVSYCNIFTCTIKLASFYDIPVVMNRSSEMENVCFKKDIRLSVYYAKFAVHIRTNE